MRSFNRLPIIVAVVALITMGAAAAVNRSDGADGRTTNERAIHRPA